MLANRFIPVVINIQFTTLLFYMCIQNNQYHQAIAQFGYLLCLNHLFCTAYDTVICIVFGCHILTHRSINSFSCINSICRQYLN